MQSYMVTGNEYFIITDERKVYRKDGKPTNLPETETTITIPLYGYLKEVEKEWLYWLSYFKLSLPSGFEEYVFEYDFKKIYSLNHMRVDPMMVIFKNPVYLNKDKTFRLIARFPKYAISTIGVMYNTITKSYTKPNIKIMNYLVSSVIDQAGLYSSVSQSTHRLVATTWVKNDDYNKYYLVDHIDGNKQNCHYTNLRWVDHIGNNRAAVAQGLRTDNYRIVSRNVNTGEIKEHGSLTDASKFIGRSRINSAHTPLRHNFIWKGINGEFELKRANDIRPWYFIDKEMVKSVKTDIKVRVVINGITKEYTSIHNAALDILDKNVMISKERFKSEVLRKYPEAEFDITVKVMWQAMKDDKVYEATTSKALSEMLPEFVSETTIVKYCRFEKCYNDWKFRLKPEYDDIPWAECVDKQPSNKSKKIYAKNVMTGQHYIYNSLREAGRSLNVDKKTVTSVIRNNEILFNTFKLSLSPYAETHS